MRGRRISAELLRINNILMDLIQLKAGNDTIVVLSSSSLANEVLDKHGGSTDNRPDFASATLVTEGKYLPLMKSGTVFNVYYRYHVTRLNIPFCRCILELQEHTKGCLCSSQREATRIAQEPTAI